MNVHVKTGDTVVILSGKDKGKKGKVLAVSPKEGKVIVEGCNMIKKHVNLAVWASRAVSLTLKAQCILPK